MKRELVDDIYKRLLNEDWKGLPPYLKGGPNGNVHVHGSLFRI